VSLFAGQALLKEVYIEINRHMVYDRKDIFFHCSNVEREPLVACRFRCRERGEELVRDPLLTGADDLPNGSGERR
jgi:hypothetical protein